MSFSYDTKNELCRLPVQKLCCARAEAYGILLFCNTFSATEVRIITENPHFAARLPKLFRRAFNLQFDRQPEPEQEEGKTELVIAVGCTGGRHRSVAMTHALAEDIRNLGYRVRENHRDMNR